MTTWQDQQPKSRRALRESERLHTQVSPSEADVDAAAPLQQQAWNEQPIPSTLGYPSAAVPKEHHTVPAPAATPPSEEPLRRPRQSRREADSTSTESPAYRLRDFSPETRGSTFSSTQSESAGTPSTPSASGIENAFQQTPVDTLRPVSEMTLGSVPHTETPIEHTLTRREIRELRNAAMNEHPTLAAPDAPAHVSQAPEAHVPEAHAPEVQVPVAPVAPPVDLVSPPAATPVVSPVEGELASAMAEFDRMFQEAPPASEAPRRSRRAAPAPEAEQPQQAPAAPVQQPSQSAAETVPEPTHQQTHQPEVAPASEPAPEPMNWLAPPPPSEQAEPLREVVTAPEVYTAPVGHWSHQQVVDEADEAVRPHQRDIASSDAITTSALVLPNFPPSMPTTGPVSGTGEILMTGSIALPRSLGVNGLHPSRYDRPDIDDIIDAADRSDVAPDSAPVRAVRAVSTYTSSQSIISAKRPKGSNLPMVLSITAGVMMVGVVVLVIVGMIFKIF